jgi:hypothetical protein
MAKRSRLNPNKDSQSVLKQLKKQSILVRRKVGLRHVIKTDGTVEYVGYNIGYDRNNRHMPNFYPGVFHTRAVVQYNDERAELEATLGHPGWEAHPLYVGDRFPLNLLATQLYAARFDARCQLRNLPTIYGDAVLITDNRMHWLFRPNDISIEDVERTNDMLSTPRDLIKDAGSAHIFFHTEPNQQDIFTLKMHWL